MSIIERIRRDINHGMPTKITTTLATHDETITETIRFRPTRGVGFRIERTTNISRRVNGGLNDLADNFLAEAREVLSPQD